MPEDFSKFKRVWYVKKNKLFFLSLSTGFSIDREFYLPYLFYMKKILLLPITALFFSLPVSAVPDSSHDSTYYYLYEYALLQGLSPFTINGQKQAESRITDPTFSLLLSQSTAMGFLPTYAGLNIWFLDNEDISVSANGSGSFQMHDTYGLGMTGGLGGGIDFKNYGKVGLGLSTISQWIGNHDPSFDEYDGKHFLNSTLELYTGKIFDSPYAPSSIEIKAIHGDKLIDGFVSSFIYDMGTPFVYSIGHSGRLNMFFGELYCVNPLDERYSFNLGYLSDSPYINSIGVNYDLLSAYNRKRGLPTPYEQSKEVIVRLEVGVEYKAYTEWQQDYYNAPEKNLAVNISFRMLGNMDEKSSSIKRTLGTEINGSWVLKQLYDTITDTDNPGISRIMSFYTMSGKGE